MSEFIRNMTPEQRQEALVKARESLSRRKAARAASTLRRDFKDNVHWEELAASKKVTLPTWGDAPTPTIMRGFLKKIGVSVEEYLEWAGEPTLRTFAQANPLWPARAWAGIVLEQFAS